MLSAAQKREKKREREREREREIIKAADLRIKNYKYSVKMNDSQPNL
jgi:hypothetical protein